MIFNYLFIIFYASAYRSTVSLLSGQYNKHWGIGKDFYAYHTFVVNWPLLSSSAIKTQLFLASLVLSNKGVIHSIV